MEKALVKGIFPIPIYYNSITRNFTNKELDIISKLETHKNEGNLTSQNNFILDNKLKLLKKEILKHINFYFDNVLLAKDVKPYITQSWVNYTKLGQYHHKHTHPNSLVSGVLYINADEKNDAINFHKEKNNEIQIQTKESNFFNSSNFILPVKTNDLVLFPSSLFHSVHYKTGFNLRVSLAFNVYVKGILGNKKELTYLRV
jgi:uncharacterized protein (TIGR02466 family)